MVPGVRSDLLGEFAVIAIDRTIYSDAAIFKTAYWYTDRFFLYLDILEGNRLSVELRAKDDKNAASLPDACRDFCNSLVDYRVRDLVLKETGKIREALVFKAFSAGVPTPGLPGITTNESRIQAAQKE